MPPSTLLRLRLPLPTHRISALTTPRPRAPIPFQHRSQAYLQPHSHRSLSTTHTHLSSESDKKSAVKDREKINTDADEYSQSTTDDDTARNEEAAFNPNITDPQEAKEKAGEGNDSNPLDASPANPALSQGTAEEQGGAKKKLSEGGGGRKGGGEQGKGEQSV